jgi:hypothetical protein
MHFQIMKDANTSGYNGDTADLYLATFQRPENFALFLTMRPSLVGLNRPTSGRHSATQRSCIDGAGGLRASSW